MRDTLPTLSKPWKIECDILNRDSNGGEGIHWTCWLVKNDECFYFDSYSLISPVELDYYIKISL